jgi:hypothetical protein
MTKRLLLLVSLASGCGGGDNSNPSFSNAIPSRQSLEVSVPAGGAPAAVRAGSAAPGETADLYMLTRETAARVNGQVASTQPAAVGPDSARWGPLADALSPVAWQLVVQRVGSGAYIFQLQVRPKAGGDADFQSFLQGASQRVSTDGLSQGTFSVDLGVAHQLDPVGNPLDGQIVAAWNTQTAAREVHLYLAGVHAPFEPPATADVGAVVFPDGSGAVALDANANLLGSVDALDVGRVGSRWNATGAGRADAELHEGDAGTGAQVTECWDASFGLVYFRAQSADGGATGGDAAACVFADPLE